MSDDLSSSPYTPTVERDNRPLHVVHWPPSWYAPLPTPKINALMKKEIKEATMGESLTGQNKEQDVPPTALPLKAKHRQSQVTRVAQEQLSLSCGVSASCHLTSTSYLPSLCSPRNVNHSVSSQKRDSEKPGKPPARLRHFHSLSPHGTLREVLTLFFFLRQDFQVVQASLSHTLQPRMTLNT